MQLAHPTDAARRRLTDVFRHSGLGGVAGLCLEALEPLAPVLSQLMYAGAPFLGSRATEMARMLESDGGISAAAQQLLAHERPTEANPDA